MVVDFLVYTVKGYLIKNKKDVKTLDKIESLTNTGIFICEPYCMQFGIITVPCIPKNFIINELSLCETR